MLKCAKSRTSHLQVFCKIFLNSQKKTLVSDSFFNKVASELLQNFMSNFLYTSGRLLLRIKDFAYFNFLSFKSYNKGNKIFSKLFSVNYLVNYLVNLSLVNYFSNLKYKNWLKRH